MELNVAKCILDEAIIGEFLDVLPDDENNYISEAEYFLEEAKKSWNVGMRHPTVESIIRLGDPTFAGEKSVEVTEGLEEPAKPKRGRPKKKVEDTYPRRSSGGISESDEREAETYLEHLPIPKDFDVEPSDLPLDFTELSDHDVRKLHSEYNAYYARAVWLLAVTRSELANAEHLRDDAYRQAFAKVEKIDPQTEKAKLRDVLVSEASESEDFLKYEAEVRKLEKDEIIYKALVEIYSSSVERLSRDATMRQNEWEREH